jgi:hypothetical protein
MAAIPPVLGDITPPSSAPVESPQNQQQGGPYGLNNIKLDERRPDLVGALRQLVTDYRAEGLVSRRHEIRRIRQARMFWQGIQYAYWDAQGDGQWVVPFTSRTFDDKDQEEQPRFMYVTNIYLAYGLTFVAVLSSDVPNVRTRPQKASKIEDVRASEAATNVINLVEENNQPKEMLADVGYYLFTDGKIGGYVRFVSDGERFGTTEQPIITQSYQPMGEDSYACPGCNTLSSEGDVAATGMLACPNCGTQLGPDNMQKAPRVAVPMQTGTKEVPNGQEVIDIVGGLELNTPVWARKQHQFPYLQWQLEVHRAELKAQYPHIEDKIQAGGAQGADEVYARTSRLSVAQGLPSIVPADNLYDLITYSRTWIRPRSFFRIEDKAIRAELLKLFPHGCYVAFAGDTYCESRDEKMDDHWRIMHAYPGEGQNRPSVGDPIVELNQKVNTLTNLMMEMYEEDLGENFFDPEVLSADAISNRTVEPGSWTPARPRAGTNLEASFHKTQSGDVPPSLLEYADLLANEQSQFLTGLFPAIFGGEAKGAGGETAKGYQLSRDQAMGRIGLVWGRLKDSFYPDLMMLAVKCFAENRTDDVEIAVEGIDGKDQADWIRLNELQGNIKVVAEGDENFPRMATQQLASLEKLFGLLGTDPGFLEMMDLPANLTWVKGIAGLTDLELPDVDSAHKQMSETKQLFQSPPTMGPDGQPASTVPVDMMMDNHDAEMRDMERVANGEEGLKQKRTNPQGYANFRAHYIEHLKGKMQKAALLAPPPAPAPEPGKGPPKPNAKAS